MTATKRKTVLRSIRIKEELDEQLLNDASEKGVSFSSITSVILSKYVEWDRYAEKYGFVAITRDGFISFLNAIEDEKIADVAKKLGSTNPKEMTLFWFKKLNIHTFLAYLSLYCKYGKIAESEFENNGKEYTITIHHELGPKYSIFLSHFFVEAIREIVGPSSTSEIGKNSVVLAFTLP